MPGGEQSARIDAELIRHVRDQILDEADVVHSQVRPVGVRLEALLVSSNVDHDAVWVESPIVHASLTLNPSSCVGISRKSEDYRRCAVGIVELGDVYENVASLAVSWIDNAQNAH